MASPPGAINGHSPHERPPPPQTEPLLAQALRLLEGVPHLLGALAPIAIESALTRARLVADGGAAVYWSVYRERHAELSGHFQEQLDAFLVAARGGDR